MIGRNVKNVCGNLNSLLFEWYGVQFSVQIPTIQSTETFHVFLSPYRQLQR
jgi:hypothetical protein